MFFYFPDSGIKKKTGDEKSHFTAWVTISFFYPRQKSHFTAGVTISFVVAHWTEKSFHYWRDYQLCCCALD